MIRAAKTASVLAAATAVLATAVGAAEPTLDLPGNPSTGYQWVLNEAASTGLDVVAVEMLGYAPAESGGLMGAPSTFGILITCRTSGSANLQFDYLSPDKSTVGASEKRTVTCP